MSISELHPAYILHSRRYRDTSLILDLFSRDFGKYSAVARGAQGPRSRLRGMLQPFVPLLVACVGRGDLKTVRGVDLHRQPLALAGDRLLVGLYVNELLNRLVGRHDAMEDLYERYERLLVELAAGAEIEPLLRRFEIFLLAELGYGIEFTEEGVSGRPIAADQSYLYEAGTGFARIVEGGHRAGAVDGNALLAIAADDFTLPQVRAAAKRITRLAIRPLLEGRPLNSRLLFAGRSIVVDDLDPPT